MLREDEIAIDDLERLHDIYEIKTDDILREYRGSALQLAIERESFEVVYFFWTESV